MNLNFLKRFSPFSRRPHDDPQLDAAQAAVRDAHRATLRYGRRGTGRPVVVAMVGLTGSGKSAVARVVAERLAAATLRSDDVRVRLRDAGLGADATRRIYEELCLDVVRGGGNVVLDSDFVAPDKRRRLERVLAGVGARVVYVRTLCEFDVMIGRAFRAEADPFFSGAATIWDGSGKERSAVVKIREAQRRIPLHYSWDGAGGVGRYQARALRFVHHTVNTSKHEVWRQQAAAVAAAIASV